MQYIKNIHNRFNFFDIIMASFFIFIILFLIDYFNIISNNFNTYKVIGLIIILLIIVYAVREMVKSKLWKFIYIKTINYFDKLLFIGIFTEIFLICSYIKMYAFYKNILFVIITLNLILLLIRLLIINISIKKAQNKKISVYNIYDLYNDIVNTNELILLEETAIKDGKRDLLDISLFVNCIEATLMECSPKETFIISLIGNWGSGKTSIINLVKEKINNSNEAVMETFNPWQYDDKYSLFKGFYNYIFKSFGENIGYVNYKDIFYNYQNIIFGIVKKRFDFSFDVLKRNYSKDIEEIKKTINDYILLNNKKIIVVIDDIDRLDKEQILLIFKIIKTVFDFNNIIYLLCYDEKRVDKIFKEELDIDPNYLEKIVQSKIIVPKIENYILKDIGIKSINNILKNYKINIRDKNRLSEVLDIIFKNFVELRAIIRFINTLSISIKSIGIIDLDIIDLIALEYIKYSNLGLYYNIANNSKFFISGDVRYNLEYDYSYSITEKFNKATKEKYDELFGGKDTYINLLSQVFPYVENYKNNRDMKSDKLFPETEQRKESILSKRCFNGRYFNVYFSVRHNFFTQLNQIVTDFIKNIKNSSIEIELNKLVSSVNPSNVDILFELLDMRISEIEKQDEMFHYLLNSFNNYENNARFLGLNSRDRVQILLGTLIKDNAEKAEQYIKEIADIDLMILNKVLYWVGPDKYGNNKEYEGIYNYGKNLMSDELEKLIKNNYKIFDKDNYKRHFCWLYYRENENNEEIKSYFTSQLNKENIFRALSECISEWLGNGISYEYNEDNAKLLFDIDEVDKIIQSVDYELNSDQKLILDLYKNKNEKERNIKIDFKNI